MDNYTNRTKTGIYKFNICDSFAIWDIKDEDLKGKSLKERYEYLSKNDIGAFPENELDKMKNYTDNQWKEHMSRVKYVIVSLNPGNKAAIDKNNKNGSGMLFENKPFENFHGSNVATSKDYNLAAMIYGTEVYGEYTLLTDSSEYIESDSSETKFSNLYRKHSIEIFEALYDHLDELGVPKEATIIACHSAVKKQLGLKSVQKILKTRSIERPEFYPDKQTIPHYSFRMHDPITQLEKGHKIIELLVDNKD